MKQKLLLKTMLLLCALIVGSGSVWAQTVNYSFTISTSDFNTTSYAANNNEKTTTAVCPTDNTKTFEVKWTSNQVMKNGNDMQWQKSNGYIYNSTDLGSITSVSVTSSEGTFTTYYGTSAQPSSSTSVGTGNGFFKVKVGSATGKSTQISVSFSVTYVDPTITFNNGSVRVGQNLDLSSLFTSNNKTGAVTYSIISGNSYASLDGTTLTGTAAGSVTVQASQAASGKYNAKTATATITVNEALTLSSIAITTPPTKTAYEAGETFDKTGMVVTATYSDASTDDVTAGCTFSPSAALTTSDDEITVSYTEGGVTKTATQAITVTDCVELPFAWAGGASSGLIATIGVTASGLGSDYDSNSHSPYLIKLDGTGDYILIKTNAKPGRVSIDVKMIGGADASTITVQGSADGTSFTNVEALTISGSQNSILTLKTTKAFAATDRYVKLLFTKGSNVGVGPISIAEYTDVSKEINSTYSTLTSDYALDFTNVYGMTAYIVKDNDTSDGYVTLTQVKKVPANTGLILKVNSTGYPYSVPVLIGDAEDVTGNKMTGSATTTTAIEANGGYILKNGAFHPANAGNLPAGKAYLNIAVSAGAPVLNLDFGNETTGINDVRAKMADVSGNIYDLQGRKVAQPSKGLYIVNGKKVVIK